MKFNTDYFNILRKIQNNPNLTQRDLAKDLGISLGKFNYCLKALKLKGLVTLCSQQFNLSEDYIWSHYGKVHRYGGRSEQGTIEFPMDEGNTDRYNKRWIKITDWDTDNNVGIPDPGSQRRGRLTENWTIAPMYEHIKMNEGNY